MSTRTRAAIRFTAVTQAIVHHYRHSVEAANTTDPLPPTAFTVAISASMIRPAYTHLPTVPRSLAMLRAEFRDAGITPTPDDAELLHAIAMLDRRGLAAPWWEGCDSRNVTLPDPRPDWLTQVQRAHAREPLRAISLTVAAATAALPTSTTTHPTSAQAFAAIGAEFRRLGLPTGPTRGELRDAVQLLKRRGLAAPWWHCSGGPRDSRAGV